MGEDTEAPSEGVESPGPRHPGTQRPSLRRGRRWLLALPIGIGASLALWAAAHERASTHTPTRSEAIAADAGDLVLTFGGWTPLFRGIDHGSGESPDGTAGKMKVEALRIRLDEPGVQLILTHSNGDAPLETIGETTVQFLERNGLSVAVNAHFYAPCCESAPEPKDLVGLAVSDGELVSPATAGSGTGNCVLAVGRDRRAAVLDAPAPPDLSAVDVAIAGSHVLLRDGAIVAPEDKGEGFQSAHPRTAAGVSVDGLTLYLVTIDGRQVGYSNGATLRETAAWMRHVGADDAVNFDGGGSTTMVRSKDGEGVLLNRPVGLRIPNTLRWNGSNLGAVAAPLAR